MACWTKHCTPWSTSLPSQVPSINSSMIWRHTPDKCLGMYVPSQSMAHIFKSATHAQNRTLELGLQILLNDAHSSPPNKVMHWPLTTTPRQQHKYFTFYFKPHTVKKWLPPPPRLISFWWCAQCSVTFHSGETIIWVIFNHGCLHVKTCCHWFSTFSLICELLTQLILVWHSFL